MGLLRDQHAEWVIVWERGDLRGWHRVLTTAQKIWKRVERTCLIDRDALARRVSRSTTRGGSELWNPHHYHLDSFLRKTPQPAPGGSQGRRAPRNSGPSQADKRLFEEMARTYEGMEMNLGALRQIASKKIRRQ